MTAPAKRISFDEMREAAEGAERDYGSVHAAAIDMLFPPPESYDDAWLARLHDVYVYVLAQDCTCTMASVDESGGCPRCRLLNREHDEYVGHGR